MFNRVGAKLKALAEVLCVLGIATAIIWGGMVIDSGMTRGFIHNHTLLCGLCIMIGGGISSWLVSLFIYGFGQLIENSDKLVEQPRYRVCTKDFSKAKADNAQVLKDKLAEEAEKKVPAEIVAEVVEEEEKPAE